MKINQVKKALVTALIAAGSLAFYAQSDGEWARLSDSRRKDASPVLIKTPAKTSALRLPRAASGHRATADYSDIEVYGALIYSYDWGYGEEQYGIYRFTAETIEPVALDNRFYTEGGAVCINGVYELMSHQDGVNTYYTYDTATKQFSEGIVQDDDSSMALDVTYDTTTGKVFGFFYNADQTGYMFGTRNRLTGRTDKIADIPSRYFCIAADSDGTLFAIDNEGRLGTVDKSSGSFSEIGETGITPKYVQTATFDKKGRLIWLAGLSNGATGLYVVDTSTGKASCVREFPGDEEVVGAYCDIVLADDNAPGAIGNLSLDFPEGSLKGTVSYLVPDKTYGGASLSGSLTARFEIDGKTLSKAVAPGATASFDIEVAGEGSYIYNAYVSNSTGNGPETRGQYYFGVDLPVAVSDLAVEKTGEKTAVLTWTNNPAGQNGGYVNAAGYNLRITRMPDGKVLAENFKGETITDNIDSDRLARYTYEVTSFDGNRQGGTASSEGIVFGSAIEAPFSYSFDSEDEIEFFRVVDANDDNRTWTFIRDRKCMGYSWNPSGNADDWFITPPLRLKAGFIYTLRYLMSSENESFIETHEVKLGTSASPADMTQVITEPTDVCTKSSNDWMSLEKRVTVSEDGIYYIGFHAVSKPDQALFLLDEISLSAPTSMATPAAATDLKVTVGNNGRTATITATVPVRNIDGSEIKSNVTAILKRNDAVIDSRSVQPGSAYSFTDNDIADGRNIYNLTFASDEGEGDSATFETFGGNDEPKSPTNVTISYSNGKATVSWSPVTESIHGGHIGQITYNVVNNDTGETVATGLKDTSFSETIADSDGTARPLFYSVTAMNGTVGSAAAQSDIYMLGKSAGLPFAEKFPDGNFDNPCWLITESSGHGATWTTTGMFGEDDHGCAVFQPVVENGSARISSARIDISSARHPVITFSCYSYADDQLVLEVSPSGYFRDFKPACTYQRVDEPGFGQRRVDLSDYIGNNGIMLGFHAYSPSCSVVYLDNVILRDLPDYDLVMTDFTTPKKIEKDVEAKFHATVFNDGYLPAAGYRVELLREGVSVKSVEGPAIKPGESAVIELTDIVTKAETKKINYTVRVNCPGDGNTDNDALSGEARMQIPELPAASNLKGTLTDAALVLSWDTPNLAGGDILQINEDFEKYEPFTIDDLGRWTAVDVDESRTYVINGFDDYPNAFSPMAFQVFNPSRLGIDKESSFSAASGEQFLVCWAASQAVNDDWLISPRLSGEAQTISFKVRAPEPAYGPEQYYVCYSASGRNPEDFIAIEGLRDADNDREWATVTVELPAEAKYFAIHCVSDDRFALALDDFEFMSATDPFEGKIKGYNIYAGGRLINPEPVEKTMYAVPVPANATEYYVTVVYEDFGESAPSDRFNSDEAGISSAASDILKTDGPAYDILGRRVLRPSSRQIIITGNRKILTE